MSRENVIDNIENSNKNDGGNNVDNQKRKSDNKAYKKNSKT